MAPLLGMRTSTDGRAPTMCLGSRRRAPLEKCPIATQHVLFRSAPRQRILHRSTELANAACIALGTKSKSVRMQRKFCASIVCQDGMDVAKAMQFEEPQENLSAHRLRPTVRQTLERVTDQTSTPRRLGSTIDAQGIRDVTALASTIDLKSCSSIEANSRAPSSPIRRASRRRPNRCDDRARYCRCPRLRDNT